MPDSRLEHYQKVITARVQKEMALGRSPQCIHREETLRTEKLKCCGTVEIFRCAKRRREVHHTRCKTCESFIVKSDIPLCFRGDYLIWQINEKDHHQDQPYCRFWEDFISLSGSSCQDCATQKILNWQTKYLRNAFAGLVLTQGRKAASDLLIKAVADGKIKGSVALEMTDEFQLDG